MDDVLVHGRSGRDQDRHAGLLASPGAPELLPGRGDRSRVPGEDRRVEPTDVHAELEGIRGDDAEDLAVAQAAFDGASLRGQVAAAIAADAGARPVALAQRLAQPRQQDLHGHPRAPEHDRLATRPQERQGPPLCEVLRRASGAACGLHDRGIHEQDVPLACRRAVPVDEPRRPPGQHRCELARVADRRRAADDGGPAAVVGTDPQEPPQDVGDVPAEDAAIGVQLVDDDELELLEQLEPLRVVRQDRRVEHVRVRDHHLARGADRRADRSGRVAVVGGGDDRQAGRCRQLAELGDLVLAERLGREEEQRPGRRVVGDGLEGRERVAEGLARCRRGDDDDVLAGVDGLDRLRLMRVQAVRCRGAARPSTILGSSQSGIGANAASRGGITAWWTTPRDEGRLVEQRRPGRSGASAGA